MGKTTTTVVTKKKIDGDEEETETGEDLEDLSAAPLFGDIDRKTKKIDRVSVRRVEPESGYMGVMQPDVTEAKIAAKWGGGEYRLEAKNEAGVIQKVRQIKIAGDPLFASEAEEKRWRRLNGLDAKGSGGGADVKDLILLMEERDEKRRSEQLDREERVRKEAAEREERDRRYREEREITARREAEEREERRRLQAREDDERRQRIHREEMERLQVQQAAQLAQAQQFFQQLTTAMKADAKNAGEQNPVSLLVTGMQLARELGGGAGDGPDALTSLIQRLPETLQEVRKTAAGAYAEITGKGGGAGKGGKMKADQLLISGPTATKAKKVLRALAAAGKDPEAEISKLLDFAAGAFPSTPTPATPAKPSPAPAARGKPTTRRRPPLRAVPRSGRGRAA